MKNTQKKCFTDYLDTVQLISKMARENLGEDSYFCAEDDNSALVSVFDGCGGLGARRYQDIDGHTGAYLASRIVSGAVHDWYYSKKNRKLDSFTVTKELQNYIGKAYSVCEPYAVERIKIQGSMVRKLPTTFAMAYAEQDEDSILVHIVWAGDSRVYLLNTDGLAQLTVDDTDVADALENLTSDGVMNNVLSSDGNYRLNYTAVRLNKPAIVLAATDGCFGYVSSPMEFEYFIVKSLVKSETPEKFRENLKNCIDEYAGDDFTMGIMSFYYGTYAAMRIAYRQRLGLLESEYMFVMEENEEDENCISSLWEKYKPMYERYLERN